jgi:hypothetical protein
MCIIAINVFEPDAFNVESQYFIPLFNRISWLCGQHPKGYETSNGRCNLDPTWHDFPNNSNIYFLFVTMRTWPFSKCENQFDSQIGCQVKTWVIFTRWFSLLMRTFNLVLMIIVISNSPCLVFIDNPAENYASFLPMDENRPTLVLTTKSFQNSNNIKIKFRLLFSTWNYLINSNFSIYFLFQNLFKYNKWKHDLEAYSIMYLEK